MQVIHMLFWGELDLIFTLFSLQVTIVTFWIELDLIFAIFHILHAGDLHCVLYIVLDFNSTIFCLSFPLYPSICMQVTTLASCIELDLMFTL